MVRGPTGARAAALHSPGFPLRNGVWFVLARFLVVELDFICMEYQVGILRSILGSMHLFCGKVTSYSLDDCSTDSQRKGARHELLESPDSQLRQESTHIPPGRPWGTVERSYRVRSCRVGCDTADRPVPCYTEGCEQCRSGVHTGSMPLVGDLQRYLAAG